MRSLLLATVASMLFASSVMADIIVTCNGDQPDSTKPAQPVDCCTPVKNWIAIYSNQRKQLSQQAAIDLGNMVTWAKANCK